VALALRDYEVFRGDPEALPPAMLQCFQTLSPQPQVLRVAKLQEQIIGCYAMSMPSGGSSDYRLAMVSVVEEFRRNGVGRWLVGHAIGVAESRGGRELLASLPGPEAFFRGLGFAGGSGQFRFAMIPE
jgi:GNAT superfamily N-acetyltransferase